MHEIGEAVALLKSFATVAGIAAPVTVVLWLLSRGRRWLPPQRIRAVPWSGRVCGLAVLVFVILPEGVAMSLDPRAVQGWFLGADAEPPTVFRMVRLVSGVIALPLQCLAWWVILQSLGRARPWQFGVTFRHWGREAAFGAATWLVVAPAVYLVNFIVILVYCAAYGSPPQEHKLLEMLLKTASPSVIALIVTEAVFTGPIREELLFRGILQPWLCRHAQGGTWGLVWAALAGVVFRSTTLDDQAEHRWLSLASPLLLVAVLVPLARWLESVASRSAPPRWLRCLVPLADPDRRRQAVLGVLGTAALFANIHAAVWPTPIPLLFLGLALGWLAHRTQSLVGPVVVHMLFNAFSCLVVIYQR